MSYIFNGLASVLQVIFSILLVLIFAQVILSWVGDPSNNVVQNINKLCEPLYKPFRKFCNKISSTFDFSPIILVLIIVFLQASLLPLLRSF